MSELAAGLRSDDELTAVNAAYALAARGGADAAAVLVGTLPEETPPNKDWSGNGNGGTDPASAAGCLLRGANLTQMEPQINVVN